MWVLVSVTHICISTTDANLYFYFRFQSKIVCVLWRSLQVNCIIDRPWTPYCDVSVFSFCVFLVLFHFCLLKKHDDFCVQFLVQLFIEHITSNSLWSTCAILIEFLRDVCISYNLLSSWYSWKKNVKFEIDKQSHLKADMHKVFWILIVNNINNLYLSYKTTNILIFLQ